MSNTIAWFGLNPENKLMLEGFKQLTGWTIVYIPFPIYNGDSQQLPILLHALNARIKKLMLLNIKHIILTPQSSVLAPFITGEIFNNTHINDRYYGVKFYVNNPGTNTVNTATNMRRFTDPDATITSSVYNRLTPGGKIYIVYQTNNSLVASYKTLYTDNAPFGYTIVNIGIDFSNVYYNIPSALPDVPDNAVSVVIHISDGIHSDEWCNQVLPKTLSDYVYHVAGNLNINEPVSVDMNLGSGTFTFPPITIDVPGLKVLYNSSQDIILEAVYYQMLHYIASGGTYKMEYNNLKFNEQGTIINMWQGSQIIYANMLNITYNNVSFNQIWLDT